jgi:AmmeMemoRadiSam system protein A
MHSGIVTPSLDAHERSELLRIARVNLKEWLRSGRTPPGAPHRASLRAPSGAHVALELDGAPRGALGRLEPEKPLYATVGELTIAVATRDPGFPPLRFEQLPRTRISIAVLSEPRRIEHPPDDIELGVHGVLVSDGSRRAFLLPHVAVERGWDSASLLAEACRLAGLPDGAWRDAAKVEVFTAIRFAE